MSSLNKVMLIGNVGQDPQVKTFQSGSKIAQFTLATSEKGYTLQNGTQVPERTEWHNIIAIKNNVVDAVEKFVHKGDKLYVEGKIRTRSYDDKSGSKRYVTEIFTENIGFLSVGQNQQQSAPLQQQVQQNQAYYPQQQVQSPVPNTPVQQKQNYRQEQNLNQTIGSALSGGFPTSDPFGNGDDLPY